VSRRPILPSRESSRRSPVVDLRLAGSPRLAVALSAWGALLAAGLVALAAGIPLALRLVASAVVLGLVASAVRDHVLLSGRRAPTRIQWLADGRWRVETRDGASHDAHLAAGSARIGQWLVLAWRARGRHITCVLDPAAHPRADFRRLTVRIALDPLHRRVDASC
jgi:hypothetical protein